MQRHKGGAAAKFAEQQRINAKNTAAHMHAVRKSHERAQRERNEAWRTVRDANKNVVGDPRFAFVTPSTRKFEDDY